MFGLMIALGVAGVLLIFASPTLARMLVGGRGDPVAITRILQVVGVLLLVGALFLRPHRNDTAAFPPPPDLMEEEAVP